MNLKYESNTLKTRDLRDWIFVTQV